YMLHALGMTHVISVGEFALIPPDSSTRTVSTPSTAKTPSSIVMNEGSEQHGSLYIEERKGHIKVLNIKGVCDNGIDTLKPQLAPICEWIDQACEQGGKVLVHCCIGMSCSNNLTKSAHAGKHALLEVKVCLN
ncbi:hypothetical protein F5148DRAFT_984241, partial [Russula earlei]